MKNVIFSLYKSKKSKHLFKFRKGSGEDLKNSEVLESRTWGLKGLNCKTP